MKIWQFSVECYGMACEPAGALCVFVHSVAFDGVNLKIVIGCEPANESLNQIRVNDLCQIFQRIQDVKDDFVCEGTGELNELCEAEQQPGKSRYWRILVRSGDGSP